MNPTFFPNAFNYSEFKSLVSNHLLDISSQLPLKHLTLEDSILFISTHWCDLTIKK